MAKNNKTQVLQEAKQIGQQMDSFEKVLHKNGKALFGSMAYKKMKKALADVVDGTKKYFQLNMKGRYPTILTDDVPGIIEKYRTLDLAVGEFLKVIKQLEKDDSFKSKEILSAVKSMTDFMQDLVKKDVQAFAELNFRDPVVLPEFLMKKRARHIEVKKLDKTVGDKWSTRYPISFTDKDGIEHKGYFTKDKKADGFKETLINAFKKTIEADETASGDPNTKKYLEDMLKTILDEKIYMSAAGLQNYMEEICKNSEPQKKKYLEDFFAKLMDDKDLRQQMDQRAVIDMSDGSSIPQRNSAMSAVANLLGISNIVAHSENMTLKVGNETVFGVFMENAAGEDLSKVTENSPLYEVAESDDSNPVTCSALADAANLQVLDYICGNIDRHARNMTYKLCGKKIVGVQGIDNDLSFGTRTDDLEGYSKHRTHSIGIDDLKVVPLSTAIVLQRLKKETLEFTLRGFGLSEAERKAACERLEKVQKALSNRQIMCKEVKEITAEDLKPDTDEYGIPESYNLSVALSGIKMYIKDRAEANKKIGNLKEKTDFIKAAVLEDQKKNSDADNVIKEISSRVDRVVNAGADLFIKVSEMKASDKEVYFGTHEYKEIERAITASKAAADKLEKSRNRVTSILDVDFKEYYDSLRKIMDKVDDYMGWKPKTKGEFDKLKPAERKRIILAVSVYKQAKSLAESVERCSGECKTLTEEVKKQRVSAADELNALTFAEITARHRELSGIVKKEKCSDEERAQFAVLDELKKLGEKKFKAAGYGKEDYVRDVKRYQKIKEKEQRKPGAAVKCA